MNLQISRDVRGSVEIVKLSGEVDAYTAPELREMLIPLIEKENAEVLVDLSDIAYMDSTGLGIFIAGLKSSKKYNSTFKLSGLTPRVRRLFEITGLTDIMDLEEKVRGGLS